MTKKRHRTGIQKALDHMDRLLDGMLEHSSHHPLDYIQGEIAKVCHYLPDCVFFTVAPKLFSTQSDPEDDYDFLILPYLSFRISAGTISRIEDLSAARALYKLSSSSLLINAPFSHVSCSQEDITHRQSRLIDTISQILIVYFHFHEHEIILTRSAKRFERTHFNSDFDSPSLKDLLSGLHTHYAASVGYAVETDSTISAVMKLSLHEYVLKDTNFVVRYQYLMGRATHGDVDTSGGGFIGGEVDTFYYIIPCPRGFFEQGLRPGAIIITSHRAPISAVTISFCKYFFYRLTSLNLFKHQSDLIDYISNRRLKIGRASCRERVCAIV